MKAYKIFIHENGILTESVVSGYTANVLQKPVTRAEIRELVQKHAFELGYSWFFGGGKNIRNDDFSALYLSPSGNITALNGSSLFKQHESIEISGQDFLKLTPADVTDGTPINLPKNSIDSINSDNAILYQTIGAQKNDRNEKAWDILKHIVEGRMSVFKNLEDDPGIEKHIKMAFRYADEFIRQSNAGEKTGDSNE